MKIKLELTVDYDAGVVSYATLASFLSWVVIDAVDEGRLTGNTYATVNDYSYTVREVKE
jgi:hypothetical protein